jgi:hypothetical protein
MNDAPLSPMSAVGLGCVKTCAGEEGASNSQGPDAEFADAI